MDLTLENKVYIESLSYEELLRHLRFAPVGDKWFIGKTGEFWVERMKFLRSLPGGNEMHTKTSKKIGWEK